MQNLCGSQKQWTLRVMGPLNLLGVEQTSQDSPEHTGEFFGSIRFPCLRTAGPNQLCARTKTARHERRQSSR